MLIAPLPLFLRTYLINRSNWYDTTRKSPSCAGHCPSRTRSLFCGVSLKNPLVALFLRVQKILISTNAEFHSSPRLILGHDWPLCGMKSQTYIMFVLTCSKRRVRTSLLVIWRPLAKKCGSGAASSGLGGEWELCFLCVCGSFEML